MLGASWIAWVLVAASPDGASLVARVAAESSSGADREEAVRGLEAMGREALPSLVDGLKSSDPGARSRVLEAWNRVQRGVMLRPSLVRLDGQGRPLAEVVRSIAEQAGFPIELDQNQGERVIDAREASPIPFWEAVDRLGLRYVGMVTSYTKEGYFSTANLAEKLEAPPSFVSTSGPFRVEVQALHDHRDLSLIDGLWLGQDSRVAKGKPRRQARLTVDLRMPIEPRMWLTQEGPARAIEAVDNLGQSLLRREPGRVEADSSPFVNGSGVTEARFELDLAMPEKPGRSITRLRGSVPVALQVRQPIPSLEIPLGGAKGQTFSHEDLDITVRDIVETNEATLIRVDFRLHLGRVEVPADRDPSGEIASSRSQVFAERQLDLVDAQGHVLDAVNGGSTGTDGTGSREYRVSKAWNKSTPASLRYYRMVRAFTEVPFAFHDVPLP